MSKRDNELIQSHDITIGRHTFNIARMPAIVAVNVVKRYAGLNNIVKNNAVDERRYMREVASIVQYVLRNLILDDPSLFDRFMTRLRALSVTKRSIIRLDRDRFNDLLDTITTVAFGDKKKQIETEERALKAMVKELGPLSQREFELLFASLRPSLERIRKQYGPNIPSKKSSTIVKKQGAMT